MQLPAPAALVHADIGTGDKQASLALARALAPLLPRLTTPGAVLASDQPMPLPGWSEESLPEGVASGRYRLYRRAVGG